MHKHWAASPPAFVDFSPGAGVMLLGDLSPIGDVLFTVVTLSGDALFVDVSSGQTTKDEQPVYGRMFQVPFSDRVRNDIHLPTMVAGNIYEADHVNSILMAGRADLVLLARPHLADPYWTLHAAVELGDTEQAWPAPYEGGRRQANTLAERAKAML